MNVRTALQIRCVVPGQFHPVCDAGGKFVFGVGHIDHRSAGAFAEMFDYGPRQLFVAAIQPVQRFVEDQQVRGLDKGACKQYHPLFAGREAVKGLFPRCPIPNASSHPAHNVRCSSLGIR